MALYHGSTYYKTQGHLPERQRTLLQWSHALLRFTTWITFPQKIVPAIGALYWASRYLSDPASSAELMHSIESSARPNVERHLGITGRPILARVVDSLHRDPAHLAGQVL